MREVADLPGASPDRRKAAVLAGTSLEKLASTKAEARTCELDEVEPALDTDLPRTAQKVLGDVLARVDRAMD